MRFTVGDRVRITAGPFEGHEAVVVAVPTPGDVNNVVEVEAEVFQRLVRITTLPADLQPLSS
jgi:transcription antitermination factor NusG